MMSSSTACQSPYPTPEPCKPDPNDPEVAKQIHEELVRIKFKQSEAPMVSRHLHGYKVVCKQNEIDRE